MSTTHKVIEVQDPRYKDYLICIHDTREKNNPYIVYVKFWKNGSWHRHKLVKYADIVSPMLYITDVLQGKVKL